MRSETKTILDRSFSENDKKLFKRFSKIIESNYMDNFDYIIVRR